MEHFIQINYGDLFVEMLKVFAQLWYVWAIIIGMFFLRLFIDIWLPKIVKRWNNNRKFKSGEKYRSDDDLIRWLRGMTPNEFEEYIANLFNRLGYKAEKVGGSYDGGIDVIIKKDGETGYIQCKKFIIKEVPVGAVRDFYGAFIGKLATSKGYFISTNKFTLEAIKFAEDKPIELVDHFKLIKYINLANKNNICPQCGNLLIEKNGKFGKFYGCSNYPKCDFTKNIKNE
ncbi:MAG: restriction endonuclease [Candidatus Paceibacterota bacterium]|jgi:restriction system protein